MGDSVVSPTLHRRRDSNGLPIFSPVRQHSRAKYPGEQSLDLTYNFAKFVKKETKDRTNHAKDDCSQDISPFINRVGNINQAVKEIQKHYRN